MNGTATATGAKTKGMAVYRPPSEVARLGSRQHQDQYGRIAWQTNWGRGL